MATRKGEVARERRILDGLYGTPEFLIRRAHQIATAVFAEACADLELTPSQYAALYALREHAPIGQTRPLSGAAEPFAFLAPSGTRVQSRRPGLDSRLAAGAMGP